MYWCPGPVYSSVMNASKTNIVVISAESPAANKPMIGIEAMIFSSLFHQVSSKGSYSVLCVSTFFFKKKKSFRPF